SAMAGSRLFGSGAREDTGRGARDPCRSPPYRLGGSLTERSNKRAGYVPRAAMPTPLKQSRAAHPPSLCKRLHQDRYLSLLFRWSCWAISAGQPHSSLLDAAVHVPAAPTLLKEGIESGVPERLHGSGSVIELASMVDDHNR